MKFDKDDLVEHNGMRARIVEVLGKNVKGEQMYEVRYAIPIYGNRDVTERSLTKIPKAPKHAWDCTCGAHSVYGRDCPAFFHSDFCSKYAPRKGN